MSHDEELGPKHQEGAFENDCHIQVTFEVCQELGECIHYPALN